MLFFKKQKKTNSLEEYNNEIVKSIYNVIYHPNIKEVFTNPAHKLIILNVYHENFNYLMNNILNKNINNNLIAISFHKYFGTNVESILTAFKRSIDIISKNKLSDKIILELNEILNTIEDML